MIAPLATVPGLFGGFATYRLLAVHPALRTLDDALSTAWAWAVYAVPLAYVVEFIVALPIHRWLARRGRTDLLVYVAVGAVSGAAPFVWMAALVALGTFRTHVEWSEVRRWLTFLYFGPLCGIASATSFWLIAVRAWRPRPRPFVVRT